MLESLKALLRDHEQWLMERILSYARRQNYTKYTSTLVDAWRLSISGLSSAILEAIEVYGERVAEFTPDEDYAENPIAGFGITEARLHRKRGVSLAMFLGLLKYYRQTYQDLIREKIEDAGQGARFGLFIARCFDLLELAVSVEWNSLPLTGVCSRRSFIEQLKAEFSRTRRYQHPLSLLMMDLDHFKEINDSHGHHMGDLTLSLFSETCLESLRENDLFAIIGGEEFAAMLTETGSRRALQVAERLRKKVAKTVVSEGDASFYFQVSIGVATLRDEDMAFDAILQRADQALYQAKGLGRNRVVSDLETQEAEKAK